MNSFHRKKNFSVKRQIFTCKSCNKNTTKSNSCMVHYSLKRGNTCPSERWCNDCIEFNKDDFCPYCGFNSLGSIPCSGCRSDFWR